MHKCHKQRSAKSTHEHDKCIDVLKPNNVGVSMSRAVFFAKKLSYIKITFVTFSKL